MLLTGSTFGDLSEPVRLKSSLAAVASANNGEASDDIAALVGATESRFSLVLCWLKAGFMSLRCNIKRETHTRLGLHMTGCEF